MKNSEDISQHCVFFLQIGNKEKQSLSSVIPYSYKTQLLRFFSWRHTTDNMDLGDFPQNVNKQIKKVKESK